MHRLRSARFGVVVVALVALAMSLVSFGHKPVAYAAPAPVDMSAYTLPDGTVPVICATAGDADSPMPTHGAHDRCEACVLASAPGLGAVAVPVPPEPATYTVTTIAFDTARITCLSIFRATSRGPPAGHQRVL